MDASGADVHVLFSRDTATAFARIANDRLAEAIRRYPTRFARLAAVARQDPGGAAREMERAIKTLKLNGFIVNSASAASWIGVRPTSEVGRAHVTGSDGMNDFRRWLVAAA